MEVKTSNNNYILPRPPNATKLYALVKILVILCYVAYTVFICLWTYWMVKFFNDKIDYDLDDRHRLNENYRTHSHFFLFTGIFVSCTSMIGLWGVMKENVSVFVGLSVLFGLGFAFELVGAIKANDDEVLKYKLSSIYFEPVLVVLSIIFSLMIRSAERRLSAQPIYRQRMAESRRNSITNCDQIGKDNPTLDTADERLQSIQISPNNNNNNNAGTMEIRPTPRTTLEVPGQR